MPASKRNNFLLSRIHAAILPSPIMTMIHTRTPSWNRYNRKKTKKFGSLSMLYLSNSYLTCIGHRLTFDKRATALALLSKTNKVDLYRVRQKNVGLFISDWITCHYGYLRSQVTALFATACRQSQNRTKHRLSQTWAQSQKYFICHKRRKAILQRDRQSTSFHDF